jgi:homoserine kinase
LSAEIPRTPAAREVVVPGSVANLGAGFDTLAVAVKLYLRARIVDIRDDEGTRLTVVESRPAVRGSNALERAFALIASRTRQRTPSVFVSVESDIPMASGLGSSAAAAVAGLRIFERVTASVPVPVLLAMAAEVEGHADNAAASLLGGLTSVVEGRADGPVAVRWRWPDDLRLIVATPAVGLATAKARAALPVDIPRRDAVFNLQRALSLIHALESGEYDRLREAVRDRWHQPARAALVPQLMEMLAFDDPDVLGVFLAGAGPSVAAIARRDFVRVERLMTAMYERAGCPVVVRTLDVHQSPEVMQEMLASAPGRTP